MDDIQNSFPNNNSLNSTPLLVILTAYIYIKSCSSSISFFSFLKGRMSSFAGLLLKVSLISTLLYSISFEVLSEKFNINKMELEITEIFNSDFILKIYSYSLNVAKSMILFLKTSQILLVSVVFMCISLLIPSEREIQETCQLSNFNNYLTKQNSTIYNFCRLYAIIRIPVLIYSSLLKNLFYDRLVYFIVIVFSNLEVLAASIFLMFIKYKNNKLNGNLKYKTDVGLFSITLFFYSIFKYTVNLVDLPFEFTKNNLNIVLSVQFGLMTSIYLFLATILFPDRKTKKQNYLIPVVNGDLINNDVALIESVIEFDNKGY